MIVYEPYKKIPLHNFHEELSFEFPHVPLQVFDYYLISVAKEMAIKGHLVRRKVVLVPECGVTRYSLKSPDAMDICGILRISHVSECCCGQGDVVRTFVAPDYAQNCSKNISWYDSVEDVLHIDSNYNYGTFYIDVAVTPKIGDCELPEIYYNDLLPTLMMGTKAKIYLLANKPWTNLNAGQAFYNNFLKSIAGDAIRLSTHKQLGSIKINFGKSI